MTDLFKLNWRDVFKGCVTAILVAIFAYLYDAVKAQSLQFTIETLKQVGSISLLAGLGYLAKNFLTDSDGKILGSL